MAAEPAPVAAGFFRVTDVVIHCHAIAAGAWPEKRTNAIAGDARARIITIENSVKSLKASSA